MPKPIIVKKKIMPFNKVITVNGDKSLSIRWALLASQGIGKSRAYNLLKSLDVISTLNCLKKLGTRIKFKKNFLKNKGMELNNNFIKKKLSSMLAIQVHLVD